MVEVEVRHRLTRNIQFCWGYSVMDALAKGGYNSQEWDVIYWEFID